MIRWCCLLMLLSLVLTYDYVFIRHGARSTLGVNLPKIFGVGPEMLTSPGRSQSFYLGQQMRRRFPTLEYEDMEVRTTNTSRTKQTAEYFLKGWNNLQNEKPDTVLDPSKIRFVASPKFLPPIQLSFRPIIINRIVGRNTNQKKIGTIPQLNITFVPPNPNPPLPSKFEINQQATIFYNMTNSSICSKVDKFAPGICIKERGIIENLFGVADLINCMEYQQTKVPELTADQIKLTDNATNIVYGSRFGKYSVAEPPVKNFYKLFLEDSKKQSHKTIFEFTHDVFIFGLIRSFFGFKQFKQIFFPILQIPFLTVLRISVEEGQVSMYLNDRELLLHSCYKNDEDFCRVSNFLPLIEKL